MMQLPGRSLDVTVAGTSAGNRHNDAVKAKETGVPDRDGRIGNDAALSMSGRMSNRPPNNKKIYMEHETEIRSLSAETLATSIVLANLLSRFARIPALRLAIVSCFDQSVDMADDITAGLGKSASPDHTVKVLRIVEEMRSMVLGDGEKPKSLV
jgi:hypothetical protein